MLKRPEILAPAGNFEKMTFAVRYGADAVYGAGKDFGMRAASENFSDEELVQAVKFTSRSTSCRTKTSFRHSSNI